MLPRSREHWRTCRPGLQPTQPKHGNLAEGILKELIHFSHNFESACLTRPDASLLQCGPALRAHALRRLIQSRTALNFLRLDVHRIHALVFDSLSLYGHLDERWTDCEVARSVRFRGHRRKSLEGRRCFCLFDFDPGAELPIAVLDGMQWQTPRVGQTYRRAKKKCRWRM